MARTPRNADPAPGFPLRVGVVDMGSNAVRLMIAEFIAPTTWIDLLSERMPVRLGHDVYRSGRLDPKAMDGAVRAMERFRAATEELGVERHRAVATSAVRESDDARALVRRIKAETGFRLEVISGAEEARLVYLAARERLPLDEDPWALADLGGGSLEVAIVDAEGMHEVESHTIGSVRLLEELAGADGKLKKFRRLLDEYLEPLRLLDRKPKDALAGFAATGGNVEDLADLARAGTDMRGASVMPLADLEAWIDRLADLDVEARIAQHGLRPDRADVILPAAMVYARLARLAGVDAIHVPRVGLKEGVLLDLVQRATARAGYAERHARDTRSAAVALGRRFSFDEGHAIHVAALAKDLFDALEEVHELDEDDRDLLVAAAVLHDVGQVISYRRHHKHSEYLIGQSELPGFSADHIAIVANVARYHRKAFPSDKHQGFAALEEDDRERVTRLAAILRIADALDREHRRTVRGVEVEIDDDEVLLTLDGKGDLALERWAVGRKADLFEATFDRTVRCDGDPDDEDDEDEEDDDE